MPTLLHDGCLLHYTLTGQGDPVVFVQGVGVHGDGWRPQVEALSSDYRCLTLDNRGMGQSVPGGTGLTIQQMAGDVLALMDHAGIERAHLIGHSMGGLIALEVALRAVARVRSLGLLCTFANGRKAAPLSLRMMILGARSRVGTRAMRRRGFLRLICSPEHYRSVNPNIYAAELAPLFGHDLGDLPPIVKAQLKAMQAYDATPRLGDIRHLPVLIATAEYDPIAPQRLGQELVQAFDRPTYTHFPEASHGLPITTPVGVNDLLRRFLRQAGESRS